VLDVPEARAVAAACSGTLLVVADGESRRDDAVYAAQVLRESKVRLLGAVVHRRD
jgi:Mrp family chromosome partitioning ATPase